jgi:hypothetical protein
MSSMTIATFREAIREYRDRTGFEGDFCCRVSRAAFNELGRCFAAQRPPVPEGRVDCGFVLLEIDGVVLTHGKGDVETHFLDEAGIISEIPAPMHPANVRLLEMLRGWAAGSRSSKYSVVNKLIGEARDIADGDTKGIALFMMNRVLYGVLDGKVPGEAR